jgi:hypothetical protein
MTTLPRGRQPLLTVRDEFEIWQNREAGISVKDCAALAGVSIATVMRAMARLRKKFRRIEKLPNERRARSYLTRRENHNQL